MRHLAPTDIIRLVSGELAADARDAAERHLADCDACRAAVAAQRDLHDLLDAWEPQPGPDLWPTVERSLDQPRRQASAWNGLWQVGRAAAVIAVSVGLGYGSGRLLVGPGGAPATNVTPEGALDQLSFHVVASPSATGLFAAFATPPDAGVVPREDQP